MAESTSSSFVQSGFESQCVYAPLVELEDTPGLGSGARESVRVRLP